MVQPLAGLFKYVRKLNGYVSGRFREPLQQLSRLTALIGGKAVFGNRVGIVGKFLQLRFIGQESRSISGASSVAAPVKRSRIGVYSSCSVAISPAFRQRPTLSR